MRVLGIDPGTIRCGWGVVESAGAKLLHVDSGVIETGKGEIAHRLLVIHRELVALIDRHAPDGLSLERSFVARNVQSAFRLGEARGVVMAAAASAGVAVSEYTPMMIKKSVVGYGKAEKVQVQAAVQRLLALADLPPTDAADALAAAICHGLAAPVRSRFGEDIGLRAATRGRARSWRSVRG